MNAAKHWIVACVLAGACLLAGGCGREPTVFNESALRNVHSMVVMPLTSRTDADSGKIASGLIAVRLAQAGAGRGDAVPRLTVLEAPAMLRLGGDPNAALADAAGVARKLGADAVLIGQTEYSAVPVDDPRTAEFTKGMNDHDFKLTGRGVTLTVKVLDASGRSIYEFDATEKGATNAELLSTAAEKALGPLESLIRKGN